MTSTRDARPSDAVRLAEIHAISWQAAYRGLLSESFLKGLTPASRLEWWKSRLARVPPRWAILVVEDQGVVAGFASIGHCDDDDLRSETAGELYAMYVDPAGWDHGLGWGLLMAAEDRFQADGYSRASLWVLRDNRRARRFYEVGGWKVDGAERRMVIGLDSVTAVRYEKSLQ